MLSDEPGCNVRQEMISFWTQQQLTQQVQRNRITKTANATRTNPTRKLTSDEQGRVSRERAVPHPRRVTLKSVF